MNALDVSGEYPATQLIAKGEALQCLPATSNTDSWRVLQKKERILFSCTRMATSSAKAERKVNKIHQLNLDLPDSK